MADDQIARSTEEEPSAVAARRKPYAIVAAIMAGFVLVAGLVLAGNVLLGSGDEDAAETAARNYMIARTARDDPTVCDLSTSEFHKMVDCGERADSAPLSGDARYRDVVNKMMDFTVRLDGDDTATVTCVVRITPDALRQVNDLFAETTGDDSATDFEDGPARLSVRLGMRKVGDRWLVASYDVTDPGTY
ncbi:hypothetical protein BJF79_21950 [Actinomadura sp. CNU-125]|uniref:hypothetical protein n=1 Tax=Actinomadura sp. CNU-125 TaxID=1904961 RepID=UPI00095BBD13|nr:hypothetical protein [Actinomadura sp. CNU-125]OLT12594.1 hypothetical protein BJF79_21950 [Actinomadura sp. CNU-125]